MTLTSLPPARPPAWFLIGLLILASAGCTRRDWVDDMLVLTDVSGTWNGTVQWTGPGTGPVNFSWTLQQSGARVTGESSMMPALAMHGRVEGLVNGEVFAFTVSGSTTVRGALTVDGDEMAGDVSFPPAPMGMGALSRCPCRVHLRRSGPAPTPRPQP
jgi:hypothetical protein